MDGWRRWANWRHADICTVSAQGRRLRYLLPRNGHARRARLRRVRRFIACNMRNAHAGKHTHVQGETSTPCFIESAPLKMHSHSCYEKQEMAIFLGRWGDHIYEFIQKPAHLCGVSLGPGCELMIWKKLKVLKGGEMRMWCSHTCK